MLSDAKATSRLSARVRVALWSAVLTSLIAGAVSYRVMIVSRESDRWVRHTHEVLETLQDFLFATATIESSYRAFVLTGQDAYIDSYHAGVSKEKLDQAALRNLTVDNPVQQIQLPILARLVAEKLRFAETVIDLRRTRGMAAAAAAIEGGSGQRIMIEFQQVARSLQGEELRLLALREADVTRRLGQTKTGLILGILLGLLIAAVAGLSVERDNAGRGLAEARYRGLLEAAPDAMVVVNQGGEIVHLNLQVEKQFGYRRDELVGQTVTNIIPNGFPERLIADGTRSPADALAQQIGTGIELVGRRKDGSEFPIEIMLSPLQTAGEILVTAAIRDISLRKQVDRDLSAATSRLSHFVSESPTIIYALRVEGDDLSLAWSSENIERVTGYTTDEVDVPGWWSEHLHPEERERVVAERDSVFVRGHLIQEYRFRRPDGSYLWTRDETRVLRDTTGRPIEVVGSWSDVTARKNAERRLLESEEEYRLLFDNSPHPMWVFDSETLAFLAVNDAAVRLYGYSADEFLGMTIKDIRPAEEVPALIAYLETIPDSKSLPAVHVKHRKKDGSLLEVVGASNPIEFHGRRARLVFASDVSENRRLEAQLLQAQKMDAVGRLAGGVAHDFNNTLGVILGYTELLMREAGEAQRGKLEQILKATQRASGLTRQLLAFSRKQIVDPKVLDLNSLLSDLETMLARLIGEDVALTIIRGTDLGQVKADRVQLEQVVMNLCVNARDAMPDGGVLRLQTGNAELDAGYSARHSPLTAGRYVMLAVSDTGSGMDKETQTKIFEPFFTTKEPGKGTGLGLAMLYGTVKQAGGYVWVYSELGQGTTFKIYLPRVDEPATLPLAQPAMPSRGSETILLVEDEASLRELAREILEEHGYVVVEAAGAEQAIELAGRHGKTIDLLLTDVVMPGINGRVLAESLVAARPGLRVLYMSGYTDDVIAHRGVLEPGTLLLEKPFTARALLERVRAALGERRKAKSA